MTTNTWDNFDPTLPYWVDLESIWVEDQQLPNNIYCEEKDYEQTKCDS